MARSMVKGASNQGVIPGTPKDTGPPYGSYDPYYSHIFRDSGLGVGLGNSMGKGSHYWGSLKILLIKEQRRRWQAIRSALKNPSPLSE